MTAHNDRITGATYLERGRPVTVLIRWSATKPPCALPPFIELLEAPGRRMGRSGPRNVLIERADGTHVVRPFGDAP